MPQLARARPVALQFAGMLGIHLFMVKGTHISSSRFRAMKWYGWWMWKSLLKILEYILVLTFVIIYI